MVKILLAGCNGRMGQVVTALCAPRTDCKIVAGLDIDPRKLGDYPVYADPLEYGGHADVLLDFSHPDALEALLRYCRKKRTPLVVAATGHSDAQRARLSEAAAEVPVFLSANMSLGINLLRDLLKRAAAVLGDGYDAEIVERHHNRKLDAPSGTALQLYDALKEALPYEPTPVYDRHDRRAARERREIGLHAVRGGSIVGDHTVLFANEGEVIELSHRALSREVFATGALRAAVFLSSRTEPGVYGMDELLASV